MVIEIDGKQHEQEDAIVYDRIRTEFLGAMGISVVRFTNNDINTRFKYVCDKIQEFVPRPTSHVPGLPSKAPLAHRGGKGGGSRASRIV
jgi:very-short-patch-repair endonuclease